MKTLIAIICLTIWFASSNASGVILAINPVATLSPGDSVIYEFDGLPFQGTDSPDHYQATISFPQFPTPYEGTFELSLYENSLNEDPFTVLTTTIVGGPEFNGAVLFLNGILPNPVPPADPHWVDLQGTMKLTLLDGTLVIGDATSVAIVHEGNRYSGSFNIVPEPGKTILIMIGLVGAVFNRRKL